MLTVSSIWNLGLRRKIIKPVQVRLAGDCVVSSDEKVHVFVVLLSIRTILPTMQAGPQTRLRRDLAKLFLTKFDTASGPSC